MCTTQTTTREQNAEAEAKRIRDMAWAFDRSQREAFEDPHTGTVGRLLRAVDMAKDVYPGDHFQVQAAHAALSRAICADIRETGFTMNGAADLLHRLYSFLDFHEGFDYRGREWTRRAEA